eukprot:CAMPEP_0176046074 /NCGR_PEP_ID=MMETSP0120_2-20121206/22876_1 /TAXON_ID=160619 /ORGANISM="Kryptoperidinium foliaceum, Strain CCMP 1326" /LENGTH=247 /DNA_ID=CAMNT_0017379485 /DNA_START=44 /DNA_END=787 /DNA_ORIENTATION=-
MVTGALSAKALAFTCAAAAVGQAAAATLGLGNFSKEELRKMLAPGGEAREFGYWQGMEDMVHANSESVSNEAARLGYEYLATTTVYADTDIASCGRLDTRAVVAGTGYYAVASAQAMQNHFPQGACCWCGSAGHFTGHSTGTAPMGCMSCAKGRFLKKRPYAAPMNADSHIFEKEFDIVVADICPHTGNEAWCPERAGTGNVFHSRNHFDWAHPPPGFDNYYFVFTPAPCSAEINRRIHGMSQCHRR